MNMMKRVLSLMLALMLLLGNIPATIFAAEARSLAPSDSEMRAAVEKLVRAFALPCLAMKKAENH